MPVDLDRKLLAARQCSFCELVEERLAWPGNVRAARGELDCAGAPNLGQTLFANGCFSLAFLFGGSLLRFGFLAALLGEELQEFLLFAGNTLLFSFFGGGFLRRLSRSLGFCFLTALLGEEFQELFFFACDALLLGFLSRSLLGGFRCSLRLGGSLGFGFLAALLGKELQELFLFPRDALLLSLLSGSLFCSFSGSLGLGFLAALLGEEFQEFFLFARDAFLLGLFSGSLLSQLPRRLWPRLPRGAARRAVS